jgi:phage shock protein E
MLALALSAAACASSGTTEKPKGQAADAPGTPAPIASFAPGVVDASTARRLVAAGVRVVDVRTPAEFLADHVPGAINIPFDEIDARAAEIGPASTPVLLYCRSGRRSGIAIGTLREKGFTQLYDLKAFDLWVASAGSAER